MYRLKYHRQSYGILRQARRLAESCFGMFTTSLPATSKKYGPPRGLWSTVDEALAAKAPGLSTRTLIPAQRAEYLPAVTVDPKPHWKLSQTLRIDIPEQRLTRLENGRVFGETPIVIGKDDRIFQDLSTLWRPFRHRVFFSAKLPKLRKIKGRVLLLGTEPAESNISHLLGECIPGLKQLELAGMGIDDIDYFVVNGTQPGFIRSILDIFEIPENKRIYLEPALHIECEELIVPSRTGRRGAIDFMKDRVTAKLADLPLNVPSPRKIYISREGARFRKLVNREQIEAIIHRYGYEEVRPENHSFLEQVSMFSKAERIVTVHGAGLTHLIFAPRGCRVLELYSSRYVSLDYFFLARERDQLYHYLIGKGPRETDNGNGLGVDMNLRFDDVNCDAKLFERALQELDEEG